MRKKSMLIFESFIYYIIYLFSGLIGNIAAVVVSAVIIGFEYISSHMQAENTEFFNEVMNLVKSEMALGILLANLSVLLIYWLACRSKKTSLSVYAGMRGLEFINVLVAIVAGFVAHSLVAMILENLKPVTNIIAEYEQEISWMREGNVYLLLLVTMIVAPIVEEIVFRGVLVTTLQKAITPIGALLVTSLLFGAAHGNLVQGIYSFLLGMVLGFIRIRSGNIWNSIFMHIAFNASNIISTALGLSVAWLSPWAIVAILVILVLLASKPIKRKA